MQDSKELQEYVNRYKQVKANTQAYRATWNNSLKEHIKTELQALIDSTNLPAKVVEYDEIKNLEAVILNLGIEKSGLGEVYNENASKDFFKNNGALVFQQLYNGKISILVNYPIIEGMTQPTPPKSLEIVRPEELKDVFILRYVERFMKEITDWEDFDDDNEQMPPIGFHPGYMANTDMEGDNDNEMDEEPES